MWGYLCRGKEGKGEKEEEIKREEKGGRRYDKIR